jgi:hypothetical protein
MLLRTSFLVSFEKHFKVAVLLAEPASGPTSRGGEF